MPAETEKTVDTEQDLSSRFPTAYTILLLLIILVAALTWIIPAGQYERVMNEEVGREVAVAGTYHEVEPNPPDLRPAEGARPLDMRHDPRPMFDIVAEAMGFKRLNVVPTGGSDPFEQAREQWNDGNNVLALRPGLVMGYDRNDDTNAARRAMGIEVLELPGVELGRGRGGSRCMSCPTMCDAV